MIDGVDDIAKLRQEFLRHVTGGARSPFTPTAQSSMTVSVLTRDLEEKREQGTIDDDGEHKLDEIGKLWTEIEKYNDDVRDMKPQFMTERTYQLGSQLTEDADEVVQEVMSQSKITSSDADIIIRALNEQFQEKVMSKLENKPGAMQPVAEGRSLQEYLTDMK